MEQKGKRHRASHSHHFTLFSKYKQSNQQKSSDTIILEVFEALFTKLLAISKLRPSLKQFTKTNKQLFDSTPINGGHEFVLKNASAT